MPTRKPAAKKKAAPKPKPEKTLPDEVFLYYVDEYSYGYRRTKRSVLRMTSDPSKAPVNKIVGRYKLSETGRVEKKVNVSFSRTEQDS